MKTYDLEKHYLMHVRHTLKALWEETHARA